MTEPRAGKKEQIQLDWTEKNMKMKIELCFESRNNSCIKRDYPMPIRVTLYIIFGVIVILTVCGNFLVILSISYFKQLHSPTNYLILSLAMSDLLVGIIVMFPYAIQVVESCWYFGDFFCNVSQSFTITLVTASIINLSLISIDRYYAVCQPLLYRTKMSTKVVLIMILICWTVCPTVGFGGILMKIKNLGFEDFNDNHFSCEGQCGFTQGEMSTILSSILSFYMPGIILFGVYLKILLIAKRQFHSIQNNSGVNARKNSNNRSQAKATKTLAIIMGVFFSFWSPIFFCNMIRPVSSKIPIIVFETLGLVGLLNSAVNPLIYAFFYRWFRKAFHLIISGKIFKNNVSETTLFNE